MDFIQNNGGCCMTKKGCNKNSTQKLSTFDWLSDLPETIKDTDFVEVQFKNTRKGYYLNNTKIPLEKGDIVAVEASPGHDLGEVTLVGRLVLLQMKKNNFDPEKTEVQKVYRKAKDTDIDKFNEAKAKEQETMIKARQIAESLNLNMKIGDVEYQGDGNKAIFYYIADERVDFRQLIKVFAETFRIRIEMKQIGARQEAGRIGGIGSCGRELCCSKFKTSFSSVTTSAARIQDISLNPQKLAGQCGKLKCCMNYELDSYVSATKDFPSKEMPLETLDNTYYHFKTDVFKSQITYSTSQSFAANLVTIDAHRAKEIITMNKKGIKPHALLVEKVESKKESVAEFENVVGQDSLTRFDSDRKNQNSKSNNHRSIKRSSISKQNSNKPKVDSPNSAVQKPNNAPRNQKNGTPQFQKPIKKNNPNNTNNQ
jgi:cell fate regulator YaaT (PSP1 superfamily)